MAPHPPLRAARALPTCQLSLLEDLFDPLGDVVFFVKDREGRYLAANHTLVRRCALRSKAALIGRRPQELFPAGMGEAFGEQDREVLRSGQPMQRHLELHIYADRRAGWCLTQKLPLRDAGGAIVGVAGISRDLGAPDEDQPVYRLVARIAEQIRSLAPGPLSLARLAQDEGLSLDRVERLFQRVFHLSPREMLLQTRLDAARALLAQSPGPSVAEIAAACGYADHSAFTRQFRATVGMSPTQYRRLRQDGGG
ncbi:AraC family transcriptional regulator [Pelomonas sp. CA6]|uniref:AraC family transcriptional regulator n=1 Tax=Pelomonas sp. CA6 TaxID=2907999 RepID=UPI001F4BD8A0|nr:AraC family transcriptional regulator [Pelomonas sp. CA6]MCH7344291.1 AraC family transcriptional regulator [Pelomonas sp. CA6]